MESICYPKYNKEQQFHCNNHIDINYFCVHINMRIHGSYKWRHIKKEIKIHIERSKNILDNKNFWHVPAWLIRWDLAAFRFFWTLHVVGYAVTVQSHFTKGGCYLLMGLKMLTCYEERISVLRRWRREWWRWWGWPSPLVLDWQPRGLGEVGRNWSRRMLLEVWRTLFNKAELKLRLPYKNLCIVCYNFFLLKNTTAVWIISYHLYKLTALTESFLHNGRYIKPEYSLLKWIHNVLIITSTTGMPFHLKLTEIHAIIDLLSH